MLDRGNQQHNSRCAATDDLAPCRPPKRKDFQAPHTASPCKMAAPAAGYITITEAGSRAAIVYDCSPSVKLGGKSNGSGYVTVSMPPPTLPCSNPTVHVYVDGVEKDINGSAPGNAVAYNSIPNC